MYIIQNVYEFPGIIWVNANNNDNNNYYSHNCDIVDIGIYSHIPILCKTLYSISKLYLWTINTALPIQRSRSYTVIGNIQLVLNMSRCYGKINKIQQQNRLIKCHYILRKWMLAKICYVLISWLHDLVHKYSVLYFCTFDCRIDLQGEINKYFSTWRDSLYWMSINQETLPGLGNITSWSHWCQTHGIIGIHF